MPVMLFCRMIRCMTSQVEKKPQIITLFLPSARSMKFITVCSNKSTVRNKNKQTEKLCSPLWRFFKLGCHAPDDVKKKRHIVKAVAIHQPPYVSHHTEQDRLVLTQITSSTVNQSLLPQNKH